MIRSLFNIFLCYILYVHTIVLSCNFSFKWDERCWSIWILFALQDGNRLGVGRRWASLRQHVRHPPGFEQQTSSGVSTPSTASPVPEPPRKSNWEVIEHFTNNSKGKGSLSSSLIAVSYTGSLLCQTVNYSTQPVIQRESVRTLPLSLWTDCETLAHVGKFPHVHVVPLAAR